MFWHLQRRQWCWSFDLAATVTPYTWAYKFESFEWINSIRETNGNLDSCNSCKRLNQPFTWVAWVKLSVCFTYRIYPFETFEFFCSCIRGQYPDSAAVSPCDKTRVLTSSGGSRVCSRRGQYGKWSRITEASPPPHTDVLFHALRCVPSRCVHASDASTQRLKR